MNDWNQVIFTLIPEKLVESISVEGEGVSVEGEGERNDDQRTIIVPPPIPDDKKNEQEQNAYCYVAFDPFPIVITLVPNFSATFSA